MAGFELDFHHRPQGRPWLGWSVLCIGLTGAVFVAFFASKVEQRTEQVGALKEQTTRSERALRERSQVVETEEQRAQRKRIARWGHNALTPLKVVEANWSSQLAMVQMTMARDDSTAVIEFEASSLKEGMDLHRRLLKSGYFRQVRLLRHAVVTANGSSVVLLAIELHWAPAR